MRKKIIYKVLFEYKKKVSFRRVSNKSYDRVVQYRKPVYNAKFGLRYNIESGEVSIGGCQCLEFEMRWFLTKFFQGKIQMAKKNFSEDFMKLCLECLD